MLIKRIQNSKVLQLITALILISILAALIFIINIIPIYNPIRVDINHTGLVTPAGRNMALYENEVYFFNAGSEGRGIYVTVSEDSEPELVFLVDSINGLAANASHVFFVTVEPNDFGAIVKIDKVTNEEVARTIPIRYVMGIAADETYVYFQGCVVEENSCNSVSGILQSNFVEVIEEDEVVPVDNFRIFKSDMFNAENPTAFFTTNFQVVTLDPTNNRQVAIYYSSEIPGKTIVYQASINLNTANNALYPYLIDQVEIFDNTTGLKVLASTSNDFQFRVSETRYITRIRDFNRIVSDVKINQFQINQIVGTTETRAFATVNYVYNFPEIIERNIYFEYAAPFKIGASSIGFITSRWNKPSDGSIFEPMQNRHLEDNLIQFDYTSNTLTVLFSSEKGERIIGYREGVVYLYESNRIYSYNIQTQVKELVLNVAKFSQNTTINIDMMGKIILISNVQGTRSYRYDLP